MEDVGSTLLLTEDQSPQYTLLEIVVEDVGSTALDLLLGQSPQYIDEVVAEEVGSTGFEDEVLQLGP